MVSLTILCIKWYKIILSLFHVGKSMYFIKTNMPKQNNSQMTGIVGSILSRIVYLILQTPFTLGQTHVTNVQKCVFVTNRLLEAE